MNRRQFAASLTALFAAPALPVAARVPAAAVPAIPPGAYAWAQLIAQSQNTCSPQMLARLLNLSPQVAAALFKDMVVDGVLRAPGVAGVAKAAHPFEATGLERGAKGRIKSKAKEVFDTVMSGEDQRDEDPPLVNGDTIGLGCSDTSSEDHSNACTDQSPQESPDRG